MESVLTPWLLFAACMNVFPPIYIPTWFIPDFPNITKSPACKLVTDFPLLYCAAAVLFKLTPKCLYTYCVNPEQSNPLGLVPPYTYLHPKNCFAYDTTELPDFELAVDSVIFVLLVVVDFDVVFTALVVDEFDSVFVAFEFACSLVVNPLLDVSR